MCQQTTHQKEKRPIHQWFLGMIVASIFSFAYLIIPIYLLSSACCLILRYPTTNASLAVALPMFISIIIPPLPSTFILRMLKPMLYYFDYEAIYTDDKNVRQAIAGGKNFLFAAQPHGILSFVGMCAAVSKPDDAMKVPTAAASAVLQTPLLKNLMGVFNLVDASAHNLKKILKGGGSVLIYIGGIAELFKSCRAEERLYLKKRKGFIKLALREGVDVVPIYLFGNTSVLSALKHGPLATLSRKLQVSLTWFWGKYYLPIPRDENILYVVGKPLGLPHIEEPTQEVDKWHAVYCDEVTKLFELHKERVPTYKHKKLFID
mmetsp:Transcript_25332/g.38911  ORF Transcript_25332/g.38911 Transcript_25332/m.38911 type:complete len:319 (+) Transcript_25332:206-1162(+)